MAANLRQIFASAANGQHVAVNLTVSVSNLGSLGGPGMGARGLIVTDGSYQCKLWVHANFLVAAGDALKVEGPCQVNKVLGMRHLYPLWDSGGVVRNTTNGMTDSAPKPVAPPVAVPPAPRESASSTPQIYVKETIREIIKIPCRYCGFLNVNTDVRCASCGAPTK